MEGICKHAEIVQLKAPGSKQVFATTAISLITRFIKSKNWLCDGIFIISSSALSIQIFPLWLFITYVVISFIIDRFPNDTSYITTMLQWLPLGSSLFVQLPINFSTTGRATTYDRVYY